MVSLATSLLRLPTNPSRYQTHYVRLVWSQRRPTGTRRAAQNTLADYLYLEEAAALPLSEAPIEVRTYAEAAAARGDRKMITNHELSGSNGPNGPTSSCIEMDVPPPDFIAVCDELILPYLDSHTEERHFLCWPPHMPQLIFPSSLFL